MRLLIEFTNGAKQETFSVERLRIEDGRLLTRRGSIDLARVKSLIAIDPAPRSGAN